MSLLTPPVATVRHPAEPVPDLWGVATVNPHLPCPLSGQPVVVLAPGHDRTTVLGRAVSGERPGRLTRVDVPTVALTVVPTRYRVRPCHCAAAEGPTGECWRASRPDLVDAHHDVLDGALLDVHAHHREAAGR